MPRRRAPTSPKRADRSPRQARRPALSGPTVLLSGEEKLDHGATERLWSLLELGDPTAEVAIASRVKERLRDFHKTNDPRQARSILSELKTHGLKRAMPPEIQQLGRTVRTCFERICNFHLARMSNGPIEALNVLVKRIKRIGFGLRNFEDYRIRALLGPAGRTGESWAQSSSNDRADPRHNLMNR